MENNRRKIQSTSENLEVFVGANFAGCIGEFTETENATFYSCSNHPLPSHLQKRWTRWIILDLWMAAEISRSSIHAYQQLTLGLNSPSPVTRFA